MTQSITAIILAGKRFDETDAVAKAAGTSCKAFAEIDGQPMIDYVIKALRDSGVIDKILITLPDGLPLEKEAPILLQELKDKTLTRLQPSSSPALSIIDAFSKAELPLLVTTADHAMLSADIIKEFVKKFDGIAFDAGVGVVPLDIVTAKYPDIKRTKLDFRDGGFKGANLFIFSRHDPALRILNFWKKLEQNRKKPLKMAFTLGLFFLLAYAMRMFTLNDAFKKLGRMTGTNISPVMLTTAEAALDVDTVENLEFMREHLKKLSCLLAFFICFHFGAAQAGQQDVTGSWISHKGDVIVKIEPCDDKLCAKIDWLRDDALQKMPAGQSLCQVEVLSGFRQDLKNKNLWTDGMIYQAAKNKSYHGRLELKDPDHLTVSGYFLMPALGKTKTLTRIKPNKYQPCHKR